MIQIINKLGLTLQLFSNTSISIERNNPLFLKSDEMFEDITYSFASPGNEVNKEFYNSGHLVEAENFVYEIEVQVISSIGFNAGKISYSFKEPNFDNVLLINYGALAEQTKSVKMRDIYTQDAPAELYTAASMKTVCQNPLLYPYSFFPIWNDAWSTLATTYPMINNWDHAKQEFSLVPLNSIGYTATVPYFKLKHIIMKLMEFFGLVAKGGWMDDPESETIYCYNLILTGRANKIYDSFIYLPTNLTPADFLKIIKERFQIICSPDIFNGIVYIETAKTVLNSDDTLDLSDYISEIEEISTGDKDGFTVTLKPDNSDELFIDTLNNAEKKFIPSNKLLVGSGKTAIEMKSSTLKSKVVADYSMPTTKQNLVDTDAKDVANPLRFIKYTGMKAVENGKFFPEASPLELNETDAIWWQFLNDSKQIKLRGTIPPSILNNMRSTQRIGFRTKEGAYAIAICEKSAFAIGVEEKEYVKTEISARTIVTNYDTIVNIVDFGDVLLDQTLINVKSYLNTDVTGMQEVSFDVYCSSVRPTRTTPAGPRTDSAVIKKSTDRFGIGGETINMPRRLLTLNATMELRVKTAQPKYAIIKSQKYLFTLRDGYWFIDISKSFVGDIVDVPSTGGTVRDDRYTGRATNSMFRPYIGDNKGIWIVF